MLFSSNAALASFVSDAGRELLIFLLILMIFQPTRRKFLVVAGKEKMGIFKFVEKMFLVDTGYACLLLTVSFI